MTAHPMTWRAAGWLLGRRLADLHNCHCYDVNRFGVWLNRKEWPAPKLILWDEYKAEYWQGMIVPVPRRRDT